MANQTLAQVEYAVRNKLNSLTQNRFDQKAVVTWINEALDDLARRTESLRASTTTSLAADTQSVTGPEDAVRVHLVRWKRTADEMRYDLEYRDIKNANSIGWSNIATASGTPFMWWTWGYPPSLSIYVYPIPSDAGSLEIFYYKTPASLAVDGSAASTSLDLPGGWEDAITDYAVFQALLADADDRWQAFQQMYTDKVKALTVAATRFTDMSGHIDTGYRVLPPWLWDERF